MAYEFIIYEKRNRIAYITLNRPEVMNSLHPPCHEELSAAWNDFDADPGSPPPIIPSAVVLEPSPPSGPKSIVRDDAPVASTDRTASRFDYDLDHGTPMGPDSPDVKASY